MKRIKQVAIGAAILSLAFAAAAQKPVVYPAKKQSQAQQGKDDGECYVWAKQNTGIDPANPPKSSAPPPPEQKKGGVVKGAAAGAAVGAIGGNDWRPGPPPPTGGRGRRRRGAARQEQGRAAAGSATAAGGCAAVAAGDANLLPRLRGLHVRTRIHS